MRHALAALAAAGGLVLVTGLPAAGAPGAIAVGIAGYRFQPESLTVPAGATVTWTNGDTAPHTVTGTSGPVQLDSPELAKGQSWSYTFALPGTYTYYCVVHPDMTASVTVTPALTTSTSERPAGLLGAGPASTTTTASLAVAAPAAVVPATAGLPDLSALERVAGIVLVVSALGLLLVRRRSPEPLE